MFNDMFNRVPKVQQMFIALKSKSHKITYKIQLTSDSKGQKQEK